LLSRTTVKLTTDSRVWTHEFSIKEGKEYESI
jgi:hypothetical protein